MAAGIAGARKHMEIGVKATAIFGETAAAFGKASGQDLLAVGAASGGSSVQEAALTTIESHKREINRIRGYKLQLTVAEKQRLARIQVQIQEIDQRASDGLARADEFDTRKELLDDADRIIGKPIVDADADEELAELAGAIEALLQPKLDKARAQQVERLERIRDGLEERLLGNPGNRTLAQQCQSAANLVATLKPLREVAELSRAEARAYDDLVELVNARAGAKVELKAKDAIKVAELQSSISQLQAALPPDTTQQPTSADVARAYVRLS